MQQETVTCEGLPAELGPRVRDEVHEGVAHAGSGGPVERQVDEVEATAEAGALQLLHELALRVAVRNVPDHQRGGRDPLGNGPILLLKVHVPRNVLVAVLLAAHGRSHRAHRVAGAQGQRGLRGVRRVLVRKPRRVGGGVAHGGLRAGLRQGSLCGVVDAERVHVVPGRRGPQRRAEQGVQPAHLDLLHHLLPVEEAGRGGEALRRPGSSKRRGECVALQAGPGQLDAARRGRGVAVVEGAGLGLGPALALVLRAEVDGEERVLQGQAHGEALALLWSGVANENSPGSAGRLCAQTVLTPRPRSPGRSSADRSSRPNSEPNS
mmetsp:Transcript_69519/g.182209  ORF Transcript_69519/g.182209 Transcript_69519/m.182209 type:complete len:322 (-) Transcript_69519:9-974(-)